MSFTVVELSNFQTLFSGQENAYGVHIYKDIYDEQGKQEGDNFVKKEPVTEGLYAAHLEGEEGLGIVPIREDSTCLFSVLDIDDYSKKTMAIVKNIYDNNFPLTPFRSKSGGLHLYLFYNQPIPAPIATAYMRQFVFILGLNNKTEVFPKQERLGQNQIGNWINIPYYNAIEPKTGVIKRDGSLMPFEEAMLFLKDNSVFTKASLDVFIEELPMTDAPPCLQAIYMGGHTDYRNEYLFSLARYFKTKNGDDFEFKLAEANNHLDKPIPIGELQKTIIAAHKKKDYSYKCDLEPLVSICNKAECRKRLFGIGGSEISELNYEEFIQYTTDPPYYEWIVNGVSLKFFAESDIIMQQKFRELCFQKLHVLPMRLKDLNWTNIINTALQNIVIKDISDDEDISPGALFREHLHEFLEKRAKAENKEQILVDRVYMDDKIKSYVFRAKNIVTFLIHQKAFRYYGPTEIQDRLRELGGFPKRYYINQKVQAQRVWTLPYKALEKFIDDRIIDIPVVDFKEDFDDEAY